MVKTRKVESEGMTVNLKGGHHGSSHAEDLVDLKSSLAHLDRYHYLTAWQHLRAGCYLMQ